jgi:sarcosine oxidase subunit alpha
VYRRAGESEPAAIDREVRHTRSRVSVFDASSLNKILVVGPDAAEFLHGVYANAMRNLRSGQVRYGLMLNDEGIVKDDGVLACLEPARYLVSASSAGGGATYTNMDRLLQTERSGLRVAMELVTTQWCTLCLCGPRASAMLHELLPALPEHVPHMTVHETSLEAVRVLVMAVSFTGERSFEVSVPAGRAQWMCETMRRIGERYELAPLGLEALDVLRLEKGYLEVGVDTDVDTSPLDVGWAHALQQKRGDFIGKRSLSLPAFGDPRRKQLVGLGSASVLPVGGVIVAADGGMQGHVTSSAWSPTLARPVALGLVADGRARLGESLEVTGEGRRVTATVVDARCFDPDNTRLRA